MGYDQKKLARLVLEAKGAGRSIRQYAKAANVSPSVISRIISCNYQPGIKVLQKLVSSAADPQGGVTLNALINAAGYSTDVVLATATASAAVTKAIYNLMDNDDKSSEDRKRKFKFYASIIVTTLMSARGIDWEFDNRDNINNKIKPDEIVRIHNNSLKEWWLIYYSRGSAGNNHKSIKADDELIQLLSPYIISAPSKSKKISIVTDDSKLYECASHLDAIAYKGNLSVILLHTKSRKLIGEITIAKYDENLDVLSLV